LLLSVPELDIMIHRATPVLLTALLLQSALAQSPKTEAPDFTWTPGNDPGFDASVTEPVFEAGSGPRILIDTGHKNFLPYYRFLEPLRSLAETDGFRVEIDNGSFSEPYLADYDIVLIMTALPFEFTTQLEVEDQTTFSADETESLVQWVSMGGSLLVFSEHAPFDQAINPLLKRLGIVSSIGYTIDKENAQNPDGSAGWIVFSRDKGTLPADHPILQGRNAGEQISRLMTYGGSALTGPGYANLMPLSESAENIQHPTGVGPVGRGNSQALAGQFGAGRVLALGDANGFTAMLFNLEEGSVQKAGMGAQDYQWKQFALNALRWLAGALD
jgi:hypothetical protein